MPFLLNNSTVSYICTSSHKEWLSLELWPGDSIHCQNSFHLPSLLSHFKCVNSIGCTELYCFIFVLVDDVPLKFQLSCIIKCVHFRKLKVMIGRTENLKRNVYTYTDGVHEYFSIVCQHCQLSQLDIFPGLYSNLYYDKRDFLSHLLYVQLPHRLISFKSFPCQSSD